MTDESWGPNDVRRKLSASQLKTLRAAYDEDLLNKAATYAAAASYAPAAGFIRGIGEQFFMGAGQPGHLSARDRELAILAMFVATRASDFTFSVHVYWGLMAGLEVADMCEVLLLGGAYNGVDNFVDYTQLLGEVLGELGRIANAKGDGIQSAPLLGQLRAHFK